MHILILNTQLVFDSRFGDESLGQKLAAQFVKMGHDVRLVVPADFALDQLQTPLAKRLTPVSVQMNGTTIDYNRFDTRTNAGVELRLLQSQSDSPDAYGPIALGQAVDQLIAGMDFTPEIAIIFDNRVSVQQNIGKCSKKIAAITDSSLADALAGNKLPWNAEQMDRILVHGPVLSGKLLEAAPESPLAKAIRTGKAEVLPLCGISATVSGSHKRSAKASLQTALGLPVSNDIPLFYLNVPLAHCVDVLPGILTQQIQVICKCETEALDDLLQTYPDRLCVVPSDSRDITLVNAVDFCVLQNQSDVIASLLARTIPIAPWENNFAIMELSPDAGSGTGILYTGGEMEKAIGKALGLHSNSTALNALRQRLPHTVVPLETIAQHYLN